MTRRTFLAMLAVAPVLAACGASSPPSPPAPTQPAAAAAAGGAAKPSSKITVGIINSASDAGLFIAAAKGYFKDQGLDVQLTTFKAFADEVAPLGTGQIDVATGAVNAGIFNAAVRDVNLRMVADKGSTPGAAWDFLAMMVRKDLLDSGKVKDYKDLAGLTIANVSPGAQDERIILVALQKAGLTLKDLNLLHMPFPEQATAFANKGIDASMTAEPFVTQIAAAGTAVRWKGVYDIDGNQQISVINFGPNLLQKNPDTGRRWMIAYVRALRDYNDAFGPKHKGQDQIAQLIADHTKADVQLVKKIHPAGLDPDGKLGVDNLQRTLDYFEQAGYVKQKIDLAKVVDTSFADYAAKQLGPYTP